MDDLHDHDHDEHDLGLLRDLEVLGARQRAVLILPPSVHRRQALKVLGGVGFLGLLAGCAKDATTSASSGTTATTGAGSSTSAAARSATTAASAATPSAHGSLSPIPSETGGPYPGDGSNGPNALNQSGVVRKDIRSSFGGASGKAEGVLLTVQLDLKKASTGKALAGGAVYLWHCDRQGRYSMYDREISNENYLRGVQEANADGLVEFTTAYPGCYAGRFPHIHFEVFESLAKATAGSKLRTSQLALPEAASTVVYATSGYEASATNAQRVSLARDNVFSDDGGVRQLPAFTGDVSKGFTIRLTVAV